MIDRSGLQAVLRDLDEVTIDEEEFEGPSGSGPKHWHWFIVTARRRR